MSEPGRPLAPPPKPSESYLNLEPNPFEQSFGNGEQVETPGGTKLPSVASLTSPSSLLPGNGNTPFNWGGGSLRTGPLSPAMLSGPANDYFGDTSHTLRGGFTPNESSLRTGLTPGGSGSMFPAPSPNSQALFAQLASGGATPSTLDFHRTAMNAAAAKANRGEQPQNSTSSSQPDENTDTKTDVKPPAGAFDPHDNDAANGLFMLAQGAQQRNDSQTSQQQYPVGGTQQSHGHPAPDTNGASTSPQMNDSSIGGASARGGSEPGSGASEEPEQPRPNTRAKGKRNSGANPTANGRRTAEEAPAKQPASKKPKTAPSSNGTDDHSSEDEDDDGPGENGQPKSKMTDEEKRKNFLERNRCVRWTDPRPIVGH